eukprot:g5247.t1
MRLTATVRAITIAATIFIVSAAASVTQGGDADASFIALLRHPVEALAWLEQAYAARTSPSSPLYRTWLAAADVKERLAPSPRDVRDALAWLARRGARLERNLGDALRLRAPAGSLRAAPADPPPASIELLVRGSAPPSRWSAPRLPPPVLPAPSVAPQTLWRLYGGLGPALQPSPVALVQFGVCTDTVSDTQVFCADAGLQCTGFGASSVLGNQSAGAAGSGQCIEAGLDAQMALGASPALAAIVDGRGTDFIDWALRWFEDGADANATAAGVPGIASVSHGKTEKKVTLEWATRLNTELMKLGLLGRAVFAASGDKGANGVVSGGACEAGAFVAAFPASSPYVTAVGGTELPPNASDAMAPAERPPLCADAAARSGAGLCAAGRTREQATSLDVSGFGSGGGFSRWWPRPAYQDGVVRAYLSAAATLPPAALFNASGRAFPDVAAVGGQTLLVTDGVPWAGGGTSAAAPIFATVWAAMDALARNCSGGRPLGPATPLLYQMAADRPECFTDITKGDNRCPYGPRWQGQAIDCATCHGFDARAGWDPVTGIGTPRPACMLDYVAECICPGFPRRRARHCMLQR